MVFAVLAYLLKANVVLALFAAAYYGLLRRLTFFTLNRAYLAGALLLAAAYPALPVPALLPAAPVMPFSQAPVLPTGPTNVVSPAPVPGFAWPAAGLVVYGLGAGVLLLRLLGQVLSLWLMRRRSRPALALGQPVRVLPGGGGPFSFGRTIYLSAASLADAAELPAVLHHEQAHVRQYHTFDVLLAQLATALAWPNPAAWLLRRALLDNLEYLADRAALRTGLDHRAYQYGLLRQQAGGVPAPALAFFSSLSLKNRIIMLNQPASTLRQLGRYALAASLVGTLTLRYAGTWAATPPAPAGSSVPATSLVYIDGVPATKMMIKALDSQQITHVKGLMGIQARIFASGVNNVEAFYTKAGEQTRAARALTTRIDEIEALVPLIEATALPAAARSYVAQHYPDYRLALAYQINPAAKQAAVYQVILAKDKRPGNFLLFDKAGNFTQVIPGP